MKAESVNKSSTPIAFSAIVVTFNESARLQACLQSLRFCDELIVIDLGSSDESIQIARQCGAEVVHHQRVPVVEELWPEAVDLARNDWVVFLDPDEQMPAGIETHLRQCIGLDDTVGQIGLPWQFYFRGKPLHCTRWGIEQFKGCVRHRRRNAWQPQVHRSTVLLKGFRRVDLPWSEELAVKHYWMESYGQLFEKHKRYVAKEGSSRYSRGQRFSWMTAFRRTGRALKENLVDHRGWRGGVSGWFLSFFYAGYEACSQCSLRRYQKQLSCSRDR